MNTKQKVILWIGIIAFVLMGIFPPWMITGNEQVCLSMGYSFILNPPNKVCRMDASHLCIQWVMVAVITAGLVITFKDKRLKEH
jgi:hypothetical protein